ncbi:hypothetical protein Q3H59_000014 [Pantoea sp. SORGH_AS 659]|jgi:hypothetical protein|nr:hypothetical protein [Pantoea sp. SORGH_AS_0659]
MHRYGAPQVKLSTNLVQITIAVQINAPKTVLKTSAIRNFRRNL